MEASRGKRLVLAPVSMPTGLTGNAAVKANSRRRQAFATFAAMLSLVAFAAPGPANAADVSLLVAFLLKPGEMSGFTPGKARVFQN